MIALQNIEYVVKYWLLNKYLLYCKMFITFQNIYCIAIDYYGYITIDYYRYIAFEYLFIYWEGNDKCTVRSMNLYNNLDIGIR